MMTRFPQRLLPWAMIALCLALFIYQTISLSGAIGSDADVFHVAVQRVLTDPATLYTDERGVIGTARSLQGYLYPPPAIAMLLPFGVGTLAQGHALLSWSALIAAIGAMLGWLTMAQRQGLVSTNALERTTLVAMTFVTGAVFTCRLGQVDTLILAIVTGGVWLAWHGSPRLGGAVLAIGSWIKIYPALLMLPLLIDRRRRSPALIGYSVAALLVLITSLLAFPVAVWREFFTMLPIMAERTIVNIDNQSIVAIWARTIVPSELALTSYDSIIVPAALRATVSVLAIATIAAFMWRARHTGAAQLWVAAVVTAIISLIAPLGWGHSYAYVLPLLVLCLAHGWHHRTWGSLAVALAIWAIFVVPAHRQFPMLAADSLIWHLAYARYAVAAILLLGVAWWQMGQGGRPDASDAIAPPTQARPFA